MGTNQAETETAPAGAETGPDQAKTAPVANQVEPAPTTGQAKPTPAVPGADHVETETETTPEVDQTAGPTIAQEQT